MTDPKRLRNQLRQARRRLSARQQRDHAHRLASHLVRAPELLRHKRIALYMANDGEIDPRPLAHRLQAMRKRLFLPVLHPFGHNRLWFCEWRTEDRLISNRFGIIEPDPTRRHPVPIWSLDLLLMPLTAFDLQGNRMGMGGGFYDRSLGRHRDEHALSLPELMGLAHELQRVDGLQTRPWDVPLDTVATESGLYHFSK